jgi:hypothetical protein
MEKKSMYEKPQITDTVNMEAIAGSCVGGKPSDWQFNCGVFVNS